MKPGNCCSRGVQKVARTLQDLLTIPTPQIVVRQHHDGCPRQRWAKHALTAAIEGIAINESKNSVMHGPALPCIALHTHPKSESLLLPRHSVVGTEDWLTPG